MLTIAGLRRDYRTGTKTATDVIERIFDRIEIEGLSPMWISLADRADALKRAALVDPVASARRDSVRGERQHRRRGHGHDRRRARRSPTRRRATATVVRRLIEAGAILIGKTNLDQFATGLVGMRSPYGACSSVFDEQYISGGSSSGSAVAVAQGLCAFALGTDTAGSGRVPAAFNGLVGLKPTRGLSARRGSSPRADRSIASRSSRDRRRCR